MAYDASDLSALTYANGFTLWHYRTPDTTTEIIWRDYFNDAASMLRVGDVMYINASVGIDPCTFSAAVVANTRGQVEVAPLGQPVRGTLNL